MNAQQVFYGVILAAAWTLLLIGVAKLLGVP